MGRWPGASHDSHIFNNSAVRRRFEAGEFGNGVLLGDSAYPLRNFLMTPLTNPQTAAEQMYNECHIRTRNVVERTIGMWKKRFAVLLYVMRCNTELMQKIIVATAILHNIAVINREPNVDFDNNNIVNNVEDDDDNVEFHNNYNNAVQQRIIHHFQTLL